jgi:hypothetical protein
MPIQVDECPLPILSKREFEERVTHKDWLIVAGPYALPSEIGLLRGAVENFERGKIEFWIVSENKFGTVVNLLRRKAKPRPPL